MNDLKGWIVVGLAVVGVVAKVFIWVDDWVHRRSDGESNLAREVSQLRNVIAEGRTTWDRSIEVGHQVKALKDICNGLKDVLNRAAERTERDDRRIQERLQQIEVKQARIDAHLESTDKDVEELKLGRQGYGR